MGDSRGDDGGDTRWMTYAELAQARGIKEPAAVRLVQRRKWERHKGNDGAARVAVPLAELRPSSPVTPVVAPNSRDMEALTRERQRADQAEARADRAEARADRAEAREVEARAAAERQARELTAALLRTTMAETEARGLREALEEARTPWVARLVRAWRRPRG